MQAKQMVIVIGRQFGSGGRAIGQMIARQLGVPYYDRQLICEAAKEMGCLPDMYDAQDERKPSVIRSFFSYNLGAYYVGSSSCSRSERLYQAQAQAIRRIAADGGCVILGRTADYILRDCPRMVSIFLSAGMEFREERVMQAAEPLTRREAHDIIMRHDRRRREFYEFFTGRSWGDAANYQLCIDTSVIGIENAAALIMDYTNTRSRLLQC